MNLKSKHIPCATCEDAPGGCKHRCAAYRTYEAETRAVYQARADHGNSAAAENWARMAPKWAAERRQARGNYLRPAYVR